MQRFLSPARRTSRAVAALLGLSVLLLLVFAGSAFAAGSSGAKANWRNEGFSTAKQWTTGEIGPYDEGSLVPFRLTISNPSSTKSAVVGGFSLQVTREAHGVSVFDYTTQWSGPIAPDTQDGVFADMLRTTFPAGMTLAPSQSVTVCFLGHLAVSTAGHPAAGMLNGNGVCGFSEVEADGVGSFGKRVPVKVNARAGLLGTPAIEIVESSDAPTSGVAAGTTVTFTYLVKNIGDVPLFDATVTDTDLGEIGTIPGPLAPGASQALTTERELSQTIADTAGVAAVDESGHPATDTVEFTVSVFSSARVFGSVYLDSDGNGAWDAGEIGFAGWAVQLRDSDGNVVAVALTDSAGAYAFEGVIPGREYTVTTVPQEMWILSAPVEGSFVITPASGQNAGPFDFGECSAYYS